MPRAVAALIFLSTFAAGQSFGGPLGTPLNIPDALGPCSQGANLTTSIAVPPSAGTVSGIVVKVGINHTWYGDVHLDLTGPSAVTVNLDFAGCEASVDDSSDLAGIYTFNDTAAGTLDAAALLAGTVIAPGTYRGDEPLAAFLGTPGSGTWTLTARDHYLADIGAITHFEIILGFNDYTIQQPGGAGTPIFLAHHGTAGHTFLAPVLLGPAPAISGGWFLGLPIDFPTFQLEFNYGLPFVGTAGANGSFLFGPIPVGPGGLPPGVVISSAAVHFTAVSGAQELLKPAFAYTVL